MQIIIKNLTGKCIIIQIESLDSIETLKDKIQDKEGISKSSMRLFFGGKVLLDQSLISEYNIENNSSIHLDLSLKGGLGLTNYVENNENYQFTQINVKTINGYTITLDAEGKETIEEIKKKIQDYEGYKTYLQRLIYNRQVLEDNRTLEDYKIPNNSSLYLVLKSRK